MKKRIDELLVSKKIATNKSKAKLLIKDGFVEYNGIKVKKAGQIVNDTGILKILKHDNYVGRGAKKIKEAIIKFNIDVSDYVIADVGASTGGFTDYLLQNSAKKVYAIDVGHGQLAEKLKNDKRVINLEGTNIKDLKDLGELMDLCVVDLSYISLTKTLHSISNLLKENGIIIALLKPQFEAGPNKVSKKGVIKDEETLIEILNNFEKWCQENNFTLLKRIDSPIKGKEGNKEFLVLLKKINDDLQ